MTKLRFFREPPFFHSEQPGICDQKVVMVIVVPRCDGDGGGGDGGSGHDDHNDDKDG